MGSTARDGGPPIDFGVAGAPLPGQTESGDRYLVRPLAARVLLAAIDGLGHGKDAATASQLAVSVLERCDPGAAVESLFLRCHDALARTRGAAMSLAVLDPSRRELTWLGVGNVDAVLLPPPGMPTRSRETILLRSGVVGHRLPPLRPASLALTPGDTLVLATDGIRAGFAEELPVDLPPQTLAETILNRHWRGTDDALVLVARWTGGVA